MCSSNHMGVWEGCVLVIWILIKWVYSSDQVGVFELIGVAL